MDIKELNLLDNIDIYNINSLIFAIVAKNIWGLYECVLMIGGLLFS
jgi:hypothetical protein